MPTVVIRVDGNDITDDVIIETANFTSQANGVPGQAVIRVKDVGHNYEIVTGRRMTLDIDDQRAWTGYVMQVSRVHALSVVPTGPQWARLIQINAIDINILFLKRIVFKQSNPTIIEAPLYPAGTADTTALNELFNNWLDLSSDNLDTNEMIENVGDINVGQEARGWSGSYQWGQAMASLASLPGAVWYIDPDRNVVWTDVDTPNAPFALSDRPTGGQIGYRGMELLKDGSRLVNDFLAIGFGYGSSVPVVRREQDAASIALHGRWQDSIMANGVFVQATIDRIADSVVDGSPQNKRGAKDDRVSVGLTVFEPGLRVGMKVNFESEAFSFTDVIPIRQQTITFIGPTSPRYRMVLSHEIDPPWGFIDSFWPHLDDRSRDPRRSRRRRHIEDKYDDPPGDPSGFPVQIGDPGAEPPFPFPWYASLDQPLRDDTQGPRVWWFRGYATPIQIWEPYEPKVVFTDTYTGIRFLYPQTISIQGSLGSATVTAGDTFTRIEIVLAHEGDVDDEDVVATYDSPVTSGGLRFYGNQAHFAFDDIDVEEGDTIRINCGIQGLVLIGGPSGRLGFFQTGWIRMYPAGLQLEPSDGETQDEFHGDGVTMSFQTSQPWQGGNVLSVSINGITQAAWTADYQTHTITLDFAPGPNDVITVKYIIEGFGNE